jgi:3-hydroxybutyryl-CoA dehydrogenase
MEIKKIAIIGTGIMGAGIAQTCAQAGYEVVMRDIKQELVDKGIESIRKSLARFVKSGKITQKDADEVAGRIKGSLDLKEAGKEADLIIEAIFEDMDAKKTLFKELDEVCPQHTIFASNTSALMITDMATAVKRTDKLIGMHWFNPAPVMRLIEVIRGMETSDETYNTIIELSKKLGKEPITVTDGPGFFTSRFFMSYLMEAIRIFESGITGIKEIDTMCKLGFGWPMGPFELMDMAGIDIALHGSEYLYRETGDPKSVPPVTLKKLVKAGYAGIKPGSKGGWYDYYRIKREK